MITVLACLIFLSAVVQTDPKGIRMSLIVGIPYILFDITGGYIDGFAYFFCGALIDLGIIVTLEHIRRSRVAEALQICCLFSIALNAFGWVQWKAYLPPTYYVESFTALYALVFAILLGGALYDFGISKLDWWRSCFLDPDKNGILEGCKIRGDKP